jgi:hypothetical protein
VANWQIKFKIFVRQLVHNSLQVRRNFARRSHLDIICPMCHRLDEDAGHLFFKCKEVKLNCRLLKFDKERLMLAAERSTHDFLGKKYGASLRKNNNKLFFQCVGCGLLASIRREVELWIDAGAKNLGCLVSE